MITVYSQGLRIVYIIHLLNNISHNILKIRLRPYLFIFFLSKRTYYPKVQCFILHSTASLRIGKVLLPLRGIILGHSFIQIYLLTLGCRYKHFGREGF